MSDQINIRSLNTKFLNQYAASPQELIAEAMEQLGLVDETTLIDEVNAKEHIKNLMKKKKNYHTALTRKASFMSKLGSLLVQKKLISTLQLNEALNYQKHTPIRIGEVLVKLGFIREEEIAGIIDDQTQIRKVFEKINETEMIEVTIDYREPLFEKTIERRETKPFTISETLETSDVSEAIVETLTNFFANQRKNNVNWKAEIAGIKVSIDFEK